MIKITLTEDQLAQGFRLVKRTEGWEEKLVSVYVVPPAVTDDQLWQAVNLDTACEIPGVDVFYV